MNLVVVLQAQIKEADEHLKAKSYLEDLTRGLSGGSHCNDGADELTCPFWKQPIHILGDDEIVD